MSESAGRTFRGLQEAYTSIYTNQSENLTEDTVVDELQEDCYEINEEAVYESMINYLVYFGYASDEKKAEAMLPHMSEQWTNTFAMEYVLAENFEYLVEYLIQEEGYDFGSTTLDELYETYVRSYSSQNLDEAVVTGTAAATSPIWWPVAAAGLTGLGALYGANKKRADDWASRQVQKVTDFVMQSKRRSRRQRGQGKTQTPAQTQQKSQTPASTSTSTSTSGSAGGTGGSQSPEPPKDNKLGDTVSAAQKFFEPKPSSPLPRMPKMPSLSGTGRTLEGAKNVAKWTGQHMVGRTNTGRLVRTGLGIADYVGNRPMQVQRGEKPTPTVGGQVLSHTIGGAGNIVRQAGRAINRLTGVKGVENIGDWTKEQGRKLGDWDKRGTAQDPKEKEKNKTKPQNIPGFN